MPAVPASPQRLRPFGFALLLVAATACGGATPAAPPLVRPRSEDPAFARGGSAAAPSFGETVERGSLRLVLETSEQSNLAYELACLAQTFGCSRGAYEKLWQKLGFSREDGAAVERIRQLLQRYAAEVEMPPRETTTLPFWWSSPSGATEWHHKIALASFAADGRRELEMNLALLLPPRDRVELTQLIARFEPRFHAWYGTLGGALGMFRRASVARMDDARLFDLAERVARVLGDDAGSRPAIRLHDFVRPGSGPQIDQMIEDHISSRFGPRSRPTECSTP
jgi:hypothetical protein